MIRPLAFALLCLPTATLAQAPIDDLNYPISGPRAELQAEYARHPGQRWNCTVMEWACLAGHWEANSTSAEINAAEDARAKADLEAMRAADRAASPIRGGTPIN